MIEFLSTYRYLLLIGAEVVFWLTLSTFFTLRYIFRLKKASILVLPIFLINEIFIAFLAYMDYQYTGEFSAYQLIVIILILYSLTFGKKDFQRLDYWIQKKIASWRGEPAPMPPAGQKKLYGWAYAVMVFKEWTLHLFIYLLVLTILAMTIGISNEWLDNPLLSLEQGIPPFQNEQASHIYSIWTIILIIDTIITISYFIFPKKEKRDS
jgi:hypothetical protein